MTTFLSKYIWNNGEFTDTANKAMFALSFIIGIAGYLYAAIALQGIAT